MIQSENFILIMEAAILPFPTIFLQVPGLHSESDRNVTTIDIIILYAYGDNFSEFSLILKLPSIISVVLSVLGFNNQKTVMCQTQVIHIGDRRAIHLWVDVLERSRYHPLLSQLTKNDIHEYQTDQSVCSSQNILTHSRGTGGQGNLFFARNTLIGRCT